MLTMSKTETPEHESHDVSYGVFDSMLSPYEIKNLGYKSVNYHSVTDARNSAFSLLHPAFYDSYVIRGFCGGELTNYVEPLVVTGSAQDGGNIE